MKHDGSYPIIGVNTFLNPNPPAEAKVVLQRSTDDEKVNQLVRLRDFHKRHEAEAPAAVERLRQAVINRENVFAQLVEAVKVCSLGQISEALYQVGGQYRRNM
jgi:methylmalonyl-CoA mutase